MQKKPYMRPLTKLSRERDALGKRLAEWLNSKKPDACREVVAVTVEALNSLHTPRRNVAVVKSRGGQAVRVGLPSGARVEKLSRGKFRRVYDSPRAMEWFFDLAVVNSRFSKDCQVHPEFAWPASAADGDAWTVKWIPETELGARLHLVAKLAELGGVSRVRRCVVCKKWYYAGRRLDQACCSRACGKRHYIDSRPEAREAQRKYMREYMRKRREKKGKR